TELLEDVDAGPRHVGARGPYAVDLGIVEVERFANVLAAVVLPVAVLFRRDLDVGAFESLYETVVAIGILRMPGQPAQYPDLALAAKRLDQPVAHDLAEMLGAALNF